jgi:hypothetical protein
MSARHEQLAGWGGIPGECGVECACGTTFDGFDTLTDAKAQLDRHVRDESRTTPPAELDPAVWERAELVAGLRELADWYAAHPEVPLPYGPTFDHCVLADQDPAGIAEVEGFAEALGVPVTRSPYAGHYHADRKFAGLQFRAYHVPAESSRQHADDQKILATVKAAAKAHLVDAEDLRRQLLKAAGLDGPATAPIELDGQDHADAIRITDTPGEKLPYRVECDLHTDWSSAGDDGGIDAAVAQHIVDTTPPTRRGREVLTYGHPCIDVPPGVRVLGDPDYGQTKRTS